MTYAREIKYACAGRDTRCSNKRVPVNYLKKYSSDT